jgi:hypothetical protein
VQIKFLCLNLWQGGNLMENIISFVKKENPDILALQEVYNGKDLTCERKFRSLDVLSDELGYQYSIFAPAFLERTRFGKIEQGNAFFFTFSCQG